MFIVVNRVKIIIIILIFCLGLFGYIIYLNNSQAVPVTSRQKLVIIDPGHGGVDGGCSGSSGVLEKDLNLKVSLKLVNLLNKAEIPYKMTRETDISVHDDNKKSIRSKRYPIFKTEEK